MNPSSNHSPKEHVENSSSIPAVNSPQANSSLNGDSSSFRGEGKQKFIEDLKFQRPLCNPIISEPSGVTSPTLNHVGHSYHDVFQLKQERYLDLSSAKISEMMKTNCLDNAPTQSLLSVVNGILNESIERKNGEIPHRVACLLRKVVQEIERRISTQSEHLRTQNTLYKAREEKYQSRIRVLEALAASNNEETQIEKIKIEEKKRNEEKERIELMKEKDLNNNQEISALKEELEIARKTYEVRCIQMETEYKGAKAKVEERLKEVESLLEDSRNKVHELEASSMSKSQRWNTKEHTLRSLVDFQLGSLKKLRFSSDSIKQELVKAQVKYKSEYNLLEMKFKSLGGAVENYNVLLAENRKMLNELQELKGNIRVYCRIRPFLPGQQEKKTIIEHIGENGDLVVANPSKLGRDGQRSFKFNKVFGPAATQGEVFSDTQPLIQSVLDGYNVCIFAYGQTGSGKTYTMTGPSASSKEDWGVNYRALNDLFSISKSRCSSIMYNIGVQMVEIYNEQVRDLLPSDGSQKKLGILTHSQPNGLAVPDASMNPVKSTADVIELMEIGLKNRSVGATAMNERSSRSHSIVTVHVRGTDLKTGTALHGNLHLVDLAGSERVDRSEVTGDRLKEAQHINKSLSALGDVIFALAQKSSHVPYRNSKLTQILQSSLGGQAKTLMFVQLNPDMNSFSESLSTLKFAERVSGVELGAARSSREGRDVRELMEKVASLKEAISRKDEEIERLQLLKDLKYVYPGEKHGAGSLGSGSSSPGIDMGSGIPRIQNPSPGKGFGNNMKFIFDNCSEISDMISEADSQHSKSGLADEENTGIFKSPDEERLSYISDTDHSDRSKSLPTTPRPLKTPGKSASATSLKGSASRKNVVAEPNSKSGRRWQ